MKQLSNKVSIVPVIAKADCLTQSEIKELKKTILREIKENGIRDKPISVFDGCPPPCPFLVTTSPPPPPTPPAELELVRNF